MEILQLIFLVAALISFLFGAFGMEARVNWDQLAKAFVVAAVLARFA